MSRNTARVRMRANDLLYLAGPMTGRQGLNHETFHAVARWARALGRSVVSPAEFGLPETFPWADCMRVAARAVSYCDEMWLLPGWEHSKGANKELGLAEMFGMPVSKLSLDEIAATAVPIHGALPIDLVASTITTIMQAQLVAGQAVELNNNSIGPRQGNLLLAQEGLRDFVMDVLQQRLANG